MTETYSCAGWCGGERHDDQPMLVATFNVGVFRETEVGDRLEDAGLHPADPVPLCSRCVQRLLLETPGAEPTP